MFFSNWYRTWSEILRKRAIIYLPWRNNTIHHLKLENGNKNLHLIVWPGFALFPPVFGNMNLLVQENKNLFLILLPFYAIYFSFFGSINLQEVYFNCKNWIGSFEVYFSEKIYKVHRIILILLTNQIKLLRYSIPIFKQKIYLIIHLLILCLILPLIVI